MRKIPDALPCPFCGHDEIDATGTILEYAGKDGFAATCQKCMATGPAAKDGIAALRGWNRAPRAAK